MLTLWPASLYRARVPPHPDSGSSGCPPTHTTLNCLPRPPGCTALAGGAGGKSGERCGQQAAASWLGCPHMQCSTHASLAPQATQCDQPGSTIFWHRGHACVSAVPQCGQNANPCLSSVAQCGQGLISGSRKTKYKIMPSALGMNIASSVHIT